MGKTKDEDLKTKNEELQKKLDEALFVLATAQDKIEQYEQCEELQMIDEINAKDEFKLIGNDEVIAKIEGILPAGQNVNYKKTSAILVINGERCVLSFDLIKQMFKK